MCRHILACSLAIDSLLHYACCSETICLLFSNFSSHFSLAVAGLRPQLSRFLEWTLYRYLGSYQQDLEWRIFDICLVVVDVLRDSSGSCAAASGGWSGHVPVTSFRIFFTVCTTDAWPIDTTEHPGQAHWCHSLSFTVGGYFQVFSIRLRSWQRVPRSVAQNWFID